MKTLPIINPTRNHLKHLALIAALGTAILFGGGSAAHAATITWNVAGGGTWDDVTENWTGDATRFTTGDTVIFTSATGGSITVAPGMSPDSTTVSGDYTFSGQPVATGSLTKSGGGTLALMVTPANFSSITVQGGTLYLRADQFAPNGATFNMTDVTVESGAFIQGERANIAGNLTMNGGTWWDNNGFGGSWTGPVTLAADSFFGQNGGGYNQTINGTMSGTGGFTKRGGANLTLTGANSSLSDYTGKTVVSGGTLQYNVPLSNAGVAGPLGAPLAGPNADIDLYPGTTFLYGGNQGSMSPPLVSTDRTINLAGSGSGTVTLNGNNTNDTGFQFGGFSATGTGTRTLLINCRGDRPVYTYTGGIPDMSDSSAVSLTCTWSSGSSSSNGLINLRGLNTFTGPIILNGGNNGGPGTFLLGGSASNYNTIVPGGTGGLGNGNYAGNITFTANPASVLLYYASAADQTLTGTISGPGAVTVGGTGILTLSGTNTYTGNTTVNAGAKLRLTQKAALGTNTSVYLSASGELNLDFADPDMVQVAKLYVNGAEQPVGLYKASGSSASGTELSQITGTGRLLVGIPLVADITATPAASGDAPLPVTFTDNSQSILGTLNSWAWDFGDGDTSTEQNPPLHTYLLWGTYTVTLTVGDTMGYSASTTKTITVTQPLDLIVSSAGQFATVTVNVAPAGSVTFNTGVVNPVFGGLTGSGSIALADQSATPINLHVGSDTVANTTFGGVLSGAGGLTKVGTNTFVLSGQNTYGGTTTVNGGILRIASGLVNVTVANPSFELPTTGGFSENISIPSWNLSTRVGVSKSGQPYIGPTCPDGLQGAFTKSDGSNYSYLGQAIDFPSGGNYSISFYAINRSGYGCPFDVKVDGNVLTTINASNSEWNQYTVTADLAAGSHTLTFANTQLGDKSVNFDLVTIQTSAQAGSIGAGTLYVNSPGKIDLAFSGTQSIASLYLDEAIQAAGSYGSSTSDADNKLDTYFSGTGMLVVSNTGRPTYASWAAAQNPAVSGGANADSNHDGMQNGIAYFMNASGIVTNPGLDGTHTVTWTNGGNIPASDYGTQFAVQTSTDLMEWTPVPNDGSDTNLSNTGGSVSYTLPPAAPGGKLFVRLVVTPN